MERKVLFAAVIGLLFSIFASCAQATPVAAPSTPKPAAEVATPRAQATVSAPDAGVKATPKPTEAAGPPYYQGKTITITVESSAGGNTDALARIFAAVLPRYIPGNPRAIVLNQPGAQGAVANNSFSSKAKPDGLTLMMNSSGPVSLQVLGDSIVQYDLTKYRYVGNVSRASNVVMVRKGLKEQLTDPSAKPLIVAAREGTEVWNAMFLWGKEFLGWNVRWVVGFGGTSEMELAFRRGEVSLFATSSANTVQRLMQEGVVDNICVGGSRQKGAFKRRPDFPDVPTFEEVLGAKKPQGLPWQAFLVWNGPGLIDKALAAPPRTPDNVMSILTEAYARMVKDPQFDSMTKKTVSDVYDVLVGQDVDALLKEVLEAPPEAVNYGQELAAKFGLIRK